MDNKFNLKQRRISEILSENVSEEFTVEYIFDYDFNKQPSVITFQLSSTDESVKILAGSCFLETGQFDIKTSKDIPNVGQLIDMIKLSIQDISNEYSQLSE